MVTSLYQRCLINTSKSDRLPRRRINTHCFSFTAQLRRPSRESTRKKDCHPASVCVAKEKNKQGSCPGTPLRPLQQDCGHLALESSLDSIGSPPSPLWLLACMHFHKLISPTSPFPLPFPHPVGQYYSVVQFIAWPCIGPWLIVYVGNSRGIVIIKTPVSLALHGQAKTLA